MTETQHVGTLKHTFVHYITIKMVLVLFHCQNNFKHNFCFLHLCYLVAASTGSKLQLFQLWREWEFGERGGLYERSFLESVSSRVEGEMVSCI
jgi:hypothetical protein